MAIFKYMSRKEKLAYLKSLGSAAIRAVSENAAAWRRFLRFFAYFYKYSFSEALLIQAQAPNATACGEIKHWNSVGRRVHKGTESIPIYDEQDKNAEIRYIFDVKDTYGEDRGIREDALAEVILVHLRLMLQLTTDEETFAKRLMEKSEVEQTKEIAANKKLLEVKKRRVVELNNLFDASYEDKTRGVLTEEQFLRMSAKFGQEQAVLNAEIVALEATVGEREGQLGNVEKFLDRAREIRELKTLTPAIVNALIDRIVVYEPYKKRGKDRQQRIEIVYRFVGPFDAIDEQERQQAGQTGRDTHED